MIPTSPPTKNKNNRQFKSRNKFNFSAKPMNLLSIDPQAQEMKIISMEISQLGKSGGVIFLQTNYGAYVLKANNDSPKDFFFNELALTLDVNVPTMDVIACYEEQFQNLVFQIQKYCCDDQVLFARLKSKLDFPFYQIIQFIPCISLTNIGEQKFKNNIVKQEKLYSIGMCLAFDLVINNNDRYSFIWRGDGNINNILVQIPAELRPLQLQKAKQRDDESIKLKDFVYIDHGGNMLDKNNKMANDNLQRYMDKVAEFQLNMIMYLRKENSSVPMQFEKLTKQIQFFTQYILKDSEIVKICQGIIYCTHNFIKLYEKGEIKALYDNLVKPVNTPQKSVNYWNDHWNKQLQKIHLSFAELYYVKVSAIYTTYPELINDIVARVKAKMDQYKQNKRQRVSVVSRPPSIGKNDEVDNISEGEGKKSEKNSQYGGGEKRQGQEEQIVSSRGKKWREKLQVFKSQNYR